MSKARPWKHTQVGSRSKRKKTRWQASQDRRWAQLAAELARKQSVAATQ